MTLNAAGRSGAAIREDAGPRLSPGRNTPDMPAAPGANFAARDWPGATPVLALDLGTHCGWALRTSAGVTSGRANWSERARETRGDRLLRYSRWLTSMHVCGLGLVVYELVRGHGPGQVLAAHCYAQFEGVLLMWAARHGVPVRTVHTGTLKKAIAGAGNAKKDAMERAVREHGFAPDSHDEADAIAILLWAMGVRA